MDEQLLSKYEEKGLLCPFIALRSGEVHLSPRCRPLKTEISQMATVLFETMRAIGDTKINALEIIGKDKGVIIRIEETALYGSLFDWIEGMVFDNFWPLIEEMKNALVADVAPREKTPIKLDPKILDEVKTILQDYVGDFTERVYQNQLKLQHITVGDLDLDAAKRFVFALGKAAGMIIGPSKGMELTNKLLTLLK